MDTSTDAQLLEMNASFGKWWSIWQTHGSDGKVNGWWANRRARVLSTDEMVDGLLHAVAEDTVQGFRAALLEQAHIEAILIDERMHAQA
jgi:hypothetical protein